MPRPNDYGREWIDAFLRSRSVEATRIESTFVARHAPRPEFKTVLDVCCGLGRHANALAALGYAVTGIDRDADLVEEANASATGGAHFVALDVAKIKEVKGPFDAAMCMWQSFGFLDDAGNARVLRNIAGLLRPGGRFVLDVTHRGFALNHQGPRKLRTPLGVVVETRRMAGRRETVTLEYGGGATRDIFEWRLYLPEELIELGRECGLKCRSTCARFDETIPASDREPRMQMVFEKG